MSHYFSAQFVSLSSDRESQLIRHNTRLWFACPYRPLPSGKCVGAVVGLNPGSAIGQNNEHTESIGICDPTMERILRTFELAFQLNNKAIPQNAYVQMLNLFYLRESNSSAALEERAHQSDMIRLHQDPAESQTYPFLWLAWGGSARNDDMARFLDNRQEACCWIGADLNIHFERPLDARLVRHPLCRVSGFSMKKNAQMIAQMLI